MKLTTGWTHFDTPSKDDKFVAKMSEYRQRRDQIPRTVQDEPVPEPPPAWVLVAEDYKRIARSSTFLREQSDLARWCEQVGLIEQAKLHWLWVLKSQPDSKQAQTKLGVVRYRGRFMPPNQVTAFNDALKTQQAGFKKWKDHLAELRKEIESGQNTDRALDEIRNIRDVVAVPSIEAEFGIAKAEMGKAAVYALSNMPDQAATQSLVKFAILSNYPEVRTQAAEALCPRSLYSYAPILLSALQAPNIVSFYKYELPNGEVGYQMSVYKDGPNGDAMYAANRTSAAADWIDYPVRSPGNSDHSYYFTGSVIEGGAVNQQTIDAAVTQALQQRQNTAQEAAGAEKQATDALAENDMITHHNSVIIAALNTATDQDLGIDPKAWWNWWFDYNEYGDPDTPTTYLTNFTPPRALGTGPISCFAAGTPVWAMTGPMQIQNVRPGELVLSQNPDTGELAYRPVTAITHRQPSKLLDVQLGDTQLRCTLGHPFWVSGQGWKMAKELKIGDRIHTVLGAVQVDSIEQEKDENPAYNLVVADFTDYFVGSAKVLVHDNNLRAPTNAIVPGLAAR